jgi:hypothetical protein
MRWSMLHLKAPWICYRNDSKACWSACARLLPAMRIWFADGSAIPRYEFKFSAKIHSRLGV